MLVDCIKPLNYVVYYNQWNRYTKTLKAKLTTRAGFSTRQNQFFFKQKHKLSGELYTGSYINKILYFNLSFLFVLPLKE